MRRSVRERIDDESFVSNAARAGLQVQGDEEAMRVRGRLRTGPLGLRPSVKVGRVRVGEETDLSFRTYGLDASLSLGGQQFDGRVALTDAPFSKGFARRSRLRATLSSRTQLGGRASVTLRGTLRSPGGDRAVTRSLQGSARYRLPFGHTIDAEARYRTGQDRGPRVRLAYAVPVGIPTPAFSADRATLNGRVVEFETNAPVLGVRVQLGAARRLTDDEGRFAVPVSEGTSYLRLSGLKRGRVPMLDLPRPIRPEEMNADLVIPVSAWASLIVRMVSYGYATTRAAARGADPVPKGGLAAEVVDVTDGRGGVRRRTGPDGRARFDNLRPGTWTVEPAGLQVPSDKAIEKPVYEADLAPGEADTLTVRVLPTERPEIQFKDGGQLDLDDEGPEGQADSNEVPPEDSGAVPPEDLGDVPSETASPAAQVVPFKMGLDPFAGEVGPFEAWRGALRAAEQVRASGYRAGISAMDEEGGARYRVWAGQYGRRAPASDALESLRTHFPDVRVARPSPPGEGYSVQIGAFTDWANAIRGSRDARDDGFSVFVSPIEWNGNRLYRVWVGRYGDQSTAKQERDALARQFGAAHVIRTTPPGRYAVQLGAFSQLKLARRLAWRVLRDGEKAFIQSNEKEDETRYTVLVGAFTDRSEAETRAEALSAYVPDAFVVQPR